MSAKAAEVESLENSVLRSIRKIMRAVDIYSRKLRMTCDLTGPQLACLRYIYSEEATTLSQLAAGVSLSPATVSGIVDRLEAREMLIRKRQVEDKRRVLITLTKAGRTAVGRAPPPLQEQFSRQFQALPARRQAGLERALRQIVAMMEAEELDASPILIPPGDLSKSSRS